MVSRLNTPNQITAYNVGWPSQFRFAVHGFRASVCEFRRPHHTNTEHITPMSQKESFHFSVTIHSNNMALIAAMRGLAWWCQPEICRQTSVYGTTEPEWKRDGNKVTFHFTSESNRRAFIEESKKLFPANWEIAHQKENDPPRERN